MPSAALHHEVMKHLVRRGVEAGANLGFMASPNGHGDNHGDNPFGCKPGDAICPTEIEISKTGIAFIVTTLLLFGITIVALRYTLWAVVNTLAMVETPLNGFILDAPPKPLDENGQPVDVEMSPINQRPITNSIRATIRHLHRIAGFRARWRGVVLFICYNILYSALSAFVAELVPNLFFPMNGFIAAIPAALALSLWSTAWTHVVISEPSAKPWYRRIPRAKAFKNIWLPVVVNALAEHLTMFLPVLTGTLAVKGATNGGEKAVVHGVSGLFGSFCVGLAVWVFIALPSKMALIRVQASMLPEEDEAIVNFDRSFNSKVVPEIVGGTGALSFLDAWKSIDREARLRVIKNVVKICCIEFALHLALFVAVISELAIFAHKKQKPGST